MTDDIEPLATVEDVRTVTNLPSNVEDGIIESKIEDAVFDIYRHNAADDFSGETHRQQAEKKLAALKLAMYVNGARGRQQESLGSAQRSFDANAVSELKREVVDLIPNAEFIHERRKRARIGVPRVR